MTIQDLTAEKSADTVLELWGRKWHGRTVAGFGLDTRSLRLSCSADQLKEAYRWLTEELGYAFATLIAEEFGENAWSFYYVFLGDRDPVCIQLEVNVQGERPAVPSVVGLAQGPAADWHEREIEDLFGIAFEGHPRLGEFVLHEDWPEGTNPMRHKFDAHRHIENREPHPTWEPPTIVVSPGAFAMPIGPVFSDFAEASHFLLETVGEDVIHTIPRFFYKYRGVEKIAEGKSRDHALLLAERFSGSSAFAHGLAFCQALETICGITVPQRACVLRTIFAELERLRHHAAVITGICNSTALAVAASQAALIEEDLLRLSCRVARHRYLFGVVIPGGVRFDIADTLGDHLCAEVASQARRLHELHAMLRYSSSFLDRLEEVGTISTDQARAYGLVGPVARAAGVARDIRKLLAYAGYGSADFVIPDEQDGDGYARLRVLFCEAEQSASIIHQLWSARSEGPVCAERINARSGAALGVVEAPAGAASHWLRLAEDGSIARYRITPPSFVNWHGFHLAAENFAFQDFPIILASFGLSNAECDR